jgi:hypothetical protein
MLNTVNHNINQVLTYSFAHIIFHTALLHPLVPGLPRNLAQISREYYPAYYKFANLHNFGCTFTIKFPPAKIIG